MSKTKVQYKMFSRTCAKQTVEKAAIGWGYPLVI